jgi:sulfoxide reductase heme-binding subunit YedZ
MAPSPLGTTVPASDRPQRPQRPAPAQAASPWRLWRWGMLGLLAMTLFILWRMPDVDGVRLQVRATARTSMACFLTAFTASACFKLWPGPFTQGLLRHRRQWGLLLAGSHALHAAGILTLGLIADPALFAQLTPLPSRVLGGLGYACLLAMALTSSDAAMRSMGPLNWQRLHTWGSHVIWLVFLLSCLKRLPVSAWYGLPAAALMLALGLRWAAARR